MAAGCSSIVDERELIQLLLLDIENSISIIIDTSSSSSVSFCSDHDKSFSQKSWGKSLIEMPLFGVKDIESHRINSGKNPGTAIIKTLEREGKSLKRKDMFQLIPFLPVGTLKTLTLKLFVKPV